MIPTDTSHAYSHEYASFIVTVYGVINIDLVCGIVGYFIFAQIRTIFFVQYMCTLTLTLKSQVCISTLNLHLFSHSSFVVRKKYQLCFEVRVLFSFFEFNFFFTVKIYSLLLSFISKNLLKVNVDGGFHQEIQLAQKGVPKLLYHGTTI